MTQACWGAMILSARQQEIIRPAAALLCHAVVSRTKLDIISAGTWRIPAGILQRQTLDAHLARYCDT